ncbi:MAG: sterol desaturase [Alphaproteobacteria bacterium]|nr:sterol desaturase [Alphaproteobacteria bacterium]
MVIGERLFYFARRPGEYNNRDALCSIGLNLMNSVIGIVVGFLLPLALYAWAYDSFRIMTIDQAWLAALIAFIVHEVAYYAEHRMGHRIGLMWAFHSIHHSSNEFNHSTAARGFFLDGKLQSAFALPAALLGVGPIVYFGVAAMKSAYGIWNHASYIGDLGLLEKVLATPRIHMVHHANQPQYIDRNYSQVLTVWDRMFGSFEPYREPPVVGLVNPVHDNNPLTAQFAGFSQLWARMKTADRLSDRLLYLWMPPEWSHDGVCRSDCPKHRAAMVPAA